MKRLMFTVFLLTAVLIGGYLLYRSAMPGIIADAMVSDSVPDYIPKRFKSRVEAIRAPLNKGTEAMVKKMHASDISVDQVLRAVDEISEEDAYAFLDELNVRKPANTDEVFDVAKEYFAADFDPEVFREPFNQHFTMKQIRKAITYANLNRRSNDVDIATARAIVKKVIVEKEKEVMGLP